MRPRCGTTQKIYVSKQKLKPMRLREHRAKDDADNPSTLLRPSAMLGEDIHFTLSCCGAEMLHQCEQPSLDLQVSVPLEHLHRLVPETSRILTAKKMIMNGNQSEAHRVY